MATSYTQQRSSYYVEEKNTHIGFVALALLASFLIHIVTIFKVADMRFDVTADLDQSLKVNEVEPPSHIERIHDDPMKPLDNPLTGDPTATPGQGIQAIIDELYREPDTALVAPPVSDQTLQAIDLTKAQAPEVKPIDAGWMPRQEVVKVVDRLVRDEVATMPRRELPNIERVSKAPDYNPPADITKQRYIVTVKPTDFVPVKVATTAKAEPAEVKVVNAPLAEVQTDNSALTRFGEKPSDISSFKPVDSRLMARMCVFEPASGNGRCYFRIEVAARDISVLPVVPKDIVFVQDSSRSLAEERLYFCRKALKDALKEVSAADRFNIVLFRESATFCFNGWATPNDASLATAATFIDSMKSEGNTDVFASMQALLQLPRDSKRPLIVILVTDGKATTGLTESSKIIGEFSKLNDNMSVFALGTHGRANRYLLDLLTYCNRGTSDIVTSGRWDIPQHILDIVDGASYPVLGRVGVTTAISSHAEIYPLPSANLFANRTLEYYGSYPAGTEKIVMQIRGEGGDAKCDVVFQLDTATAERGGQELREGWAKRKMHSLIGDYARNPSAKILDSMSHLSATENIPIPYLRDFSR